MHLPPSRITTYVVALRCTQKYLFVSSYLPKCPSDCPSPPNGLCHPSQNCPESCTRAGSWVYVLFLRRNTYFILYCSNSDGKWPACGRSGKLPRVPWTRGAGIRSHTGHSRKCIWWRVGSRCCCTSVLCCSLWVWDVPLLLLYLFSEAHTHTRQDTQAM